MIDDAGCHAGLTTDAQGLVYVDEFMHYFGLPPGVMPMLVRMRAYWS
jgi:hypothetical protein